MSDYHTQAVEVSVSVGSVDLDPTSVSITRSVGTEANSATVQGHTETPGEIEHGDGVEVFINGAKEFTGIVTKVELNENLLVKITAHGVRYELHNATVTVQPDGSVSLRRMLTGIFEDTEFESDVDINIRVAQSACAWITEASYKDESAMTAISNLASRLGAQMWTDPDNILHIETKYPDSENYYPNYPLDLHAGSDTNKKTRVLVQGSGGMSQASMSSYQRFAGGSNGPASVSEDQSQDNTTTKRLEDPNITTQEEADRKATIEGLNQQSQRRTGQIEHVGSTQATVLDHLVIEDYETRIGTELVEARYQIKSVQHDITADDGFVTTYGLRKPYDEAISDISAPAAAMARAFEGEIDAGEIGPSSSNESSAENEPTDRDLRAIYDTDPLLG